MAYGNRFTRWVYQHSPAAMQNYMTTIYARGRSRQKYGPKFFEYLMDLERWQGYSNEMLQLQQDEKIHRLITYAARYVPFYRKCFENAGLNPNDIQNRHQLTQLPILDKKQVQDQLNLFRSELYPNDELLDHYQTSGTTGRALDIYATLDCMQFEKACTWFHRGWGGVKVGDRVAAFLGFPVVPLKRKAPPFWVYDSTEDRMIFSLQHISKINLAAYAKQLERFKPVFVMGYPNALYLMSAYLCESNNQSIRPRAVFTGSETLMPHQRPIIEQAFGCQVLDYYGASEAVVNVAQCPDGNYHINSQYGVVEILRPDGSPAQPGEEGFVVCTGLNNMAMPLIRYRIGDRAVRKAGVCACGRSGYLLEKVTGRMEDVIVTPDGRYISRLDFVFKGLSNVAEAQLVQDALTHLRVRVVRRAMYSERDAAAILSNLRDRLGDEIQIEIEYVEAIPRTPNGKFRYVVSKIPIDLAGFRQPGDVIGTASAEDKTL